MILTTKDAVLDLFLQRPQEWLSGDQLANQLGVSRESIWKAIQSLKAAGHQIESKKKIGYHYQGSQLLNAQVLAAYQNQITLDNLLIFEEIDSTQRYAKDYVSKNLIDQPVAIVAEGQTAGYGRRGRTFYSPVGRGLYVSLILPVAHKAAIQAGLLTTSAAVAIVMAAQEFFPDQSLQLKWVNDIILNNRKVGGIITEVTMDLESQHYSTVILGFALNLTGTAFPDEIAAKAGSIGNTIVNRNMLLAKILTGLVKMYADYDTGCYLPRYRHLSMLMNQIITVQMGDQEIDGLVTSFGDDGALLLENQAGKIQSIYSGEVTKIKLHQNLNL